MGRGLYGFGLGRSGLPRLNLRTKEPGEKVRHSPDFSCHNLAVIGQLRVGHRANASRPELPVGNFRRVLAPHYETAGWGAGEPSRFPVIARGARFARSHYFPIATTLSRVRKKSAPSEIAGVERHVSPSGLLATTENLSVAGTTNTLPSSLVK